MNQTIGKIALGVALVALIIGGLAYTKPVAQVASQFGSIGGSGGAGTVSPLPSYIYPNPTNLDYVQTAVTEANSLFLEGGWTPTTAVAETATVGSCSTATSTIFAIQNPYAATSTVTFFNISGLVAQTSDIIVGTSTVPGGMTATSTLNVTGIGGLLGMAAVATGNFYTVAGLKVGPGTGYTTSGNGGYASNAGVVVGPKEYLVGLATSTAVTGGTGVTSCTYKAQWDL